MLGRGWSSASLCVDVFALGDVSVGEECEAAILNNANPPVCASKLLDYAHRDLHGVVVDVVARTVCMHWMGGVCICRGAPAFSKRSPSRQLGVHQGTVNCISRFLITCLSKARMGNKNPCLSRVGDGVRYCRQYSKRRNRNSDVRNIDASVACG